MKATTLILGVLLAGTTLALDLDECLKKDSISCLQDQLFREARSFFDQDKIELVAGISLVKDPAAAAKSAPRARSLEREVAAAEDVEGREAALEEYAVQRLGALLTERKLNWNFAPLVEKVASAARSLADAIPQQLKDNVATIMSEEGRGKKKKILKALIPLLIGLKVKLSAFMVLAYFIIALIAKKALLVSLLSLAIAGFIAIKKLLSQQHQPHHEVHEVGHHGWAGPAYGGGYSGGGGIGGGISGGAVGGSGWDSYDAHGAYSNNVAHSLAYSGQKPAKR